MKECLGVLFKAYFNSDPAGQLMVLILLALSAVSWTIMLLKCVTMWSLSCNFKKFSRKYKSREIQSNPLLMALKLEESDDSIMDNICRTGLETLGAVLNPGNSREALDNLTRRQTIPRELTPAEVEKVRSSMVNSMNRARFDMEGWMVGLSTIITLAPFGGLLGTVWGVLMVFFQMGLSKRPEISEMAPGVSSALLTTVVGLVVAIPAVAGFNYIVNVIARRSTEMENFIDDFVASIQMIRSDTDIVNKVIGKEE